MYCILLGQSVADPPIDSSPTTVHLVRRHNHHHHYHQHPIIFIITLIVVQRPQEMNKCCRYVDVSKFQKYYLTNIYCFLPIVIIEFEYEFDLKALPLLFEFDKCEFACSSITSLIMILFWFDFNLTNVNLLSKFYPPCPYHHSSLWNLNASPNH